MDALIRKDTTEPVPANYPIAPAPTVVLFLEGTSAAALRNAVTALLSAGRNVWVFSR